MVNALPRNAVKIEKAAEEGNISPAFRVKPSDLDVNLHTNNSRYLKWVTDGYDLDFSMKNAPVSAEINYIAESVYGDDIIIQTSRKEPDENIFDHSVYRTNGEKSDKKELCRIRLTWKEYES